MASTQQPGGLKGPAGGAAAAEPTGGSGRQRGRSVRERFGRAHSPHARRSPRGYAARQAAKELAALLPAGAAAAAASTGSSSGGGSPARADIAARTPHGSTGGSTAAPAAGVGYTALRSRDRSQRAQQQQQQQHATQASIQQQQQQQQHLQAQVQPLVRPQQQQHQQQLEHARAQQVQHAPHMAACHRGHASSAAPQPATAASTAAVVAAAAAAAEAEELASTPSNNPLICRLQQQLTRLKKAHQLISQELQPETPPGALAASVGVLFDDALDVEEGLAAEQQAYAASVEQQHLQQAAAASQQAAWAAAATAVHPAAAGKQRDAAVAARRQPTKQAQLEPAVASAAVSGSAAAAGAATHGAATPASLAPPAAPEPAATNSKPYIFQWLETLQDDSNAADAQAIAAANAQAAAAAAAAEAAAAAAVAAAAEAEEREHQFGELMRRLQQFLPALRATGASTADFETSWPVLEAELSALMTAARLSSLQAGRLQALDGEVLKLQSVLVLLGKHIKAGTQPQQLSELVNNLPSYGASSLGLLGSTLDLALGSALSSTQGAAPPAIRVAPAAAVHQPASPGRAAATAAAAVHQPASPGRAAATAAAAVHQPASPGRAAAAAAAAVHQPASPGRAAAVAAAAPAAKALRAAAASAPPQRSTPWLGPNSKPRASTPDRSTSGLCREDSWASASASPMRSSSAGRFGSPPRAPVAPPKHLTPDESATLMSLYKVRTTPERISYKTMWVPGKVASPNSSPPRDRRSLSPGRGLTGSSLLPSPRQPNNSAALRAHQQHGSGGWEDGAGRATAQLQTRSGEVIYVSAGHTYHQAHSSSSGGGGGGGGGKVPQGSSRRGPGLFSSSSTGQRVGTESPRTQRQHTLTVVQAEHSLTAGGVGGARSSPASAAAAAGALRSPRGSLGVQSRRDLAMSADLSSSHHQSPGQLAAYPGRRGGSPIGGMRYVARPASAEPQLQLQRQQQQLRGRNGNTMGLAASWDSSMWRKAPRTASPTASAGPSPRGGPSRFVGGNRKWGSSGYVAAALASGAAASPSVACLADEPAFQDACLAFRQLLQAQMAAGSFLRSADPHQRLSTAAKQLAVRLSPTKDADSDQVHNAIRLLAVTLQQHGVNLELQRLSPFIYTASGRKLHVRLLNGNLLVRTGGGYIDLTTALAKMPAAAAMAAPAKAVAASGSGTGSGGSAPERHHSHDVLARQPSPGRGLPRVHAGSRSQSPGRASPRVQAGSRSQSPARGERCYTDLLEEQYGGGCGSPMSAAAAVAIRLEAADAAHPASVCSSSLAAQQQQRELSLEHLMQDLDEPSLFFRRSPSPHVAVLRADSCSAAGADGSGASTSSSHGAGGGDDDGSAAAMDAAVQAAVDAAVVAAAVAAVEAAANAGLDDGGAHSGGGAPAALQADRLAAAAQAALGGSSAGAAPGGVLFEGGMCPPVPVQDKPVAAAAAAFSVA